MSHPESHPLGAGVLGQIWERLRPLDPLRSIQMKLGVLVASSAVLIAALEYLGVVVLGWRIRYGLAVAVVISLLVARVLAHGMTSPLRQMTRAASDLAAGGSPGPVRATSRDEVGELARAFLAMSRDLAAADAQRRELLGNVSHELRTPVAALRAQVENLVDGVRAPDPQALNEVLSQVERLARLVDDLLDLARTDGGAVPLRRERVELGPMLRAVVREVDAARPGRRIAIRVTPPDLAVQADPDRLAQVVTNLLDNASRHANGGEISVTAARTHTGGMVLEVTDDGPGIPSDRWETVFERFRGGTGEIALGGARDSDARAPHRDGGTGLGLAIARWAVALHGGRIAVVPAGSAGCRIRVEIPAISTESPDLHHDSGGLPA